MRRNLIISGLTGLILLLLFSGCDSTPLDPTDIGRWRPVPVVNVILDSLGVVDEPVGAFASAEDPLPVDVIPLNKDYVFGSGDTIRISIYELRQIGITAVDHYAVSETGRISIPDVGLIQVAGLTEPELEAEIREILSPDIIVDPSVSVILVNSESLVFSIGGEGIGRGSRYGLPRTSDFRLLDAITLAGGMAEFNFSNIYVTRKIAGTESEFGGLPADKLTGNGLSPSDEKGGVSVSELGEMELVPTEPVNASPEEEILEVIAPYHAHLFSGDDLVLTSSELVTTDELTNLAAPEGFSVERTGETKTSAVEILSDKIEPVGDETQIEWIFQDGKWTPVAVGVKAATDEAPEIFGGQLVMPERVPAAQHSYGWDEIGKGGQMSRVIKIPRDSLYGGDDRYNIIIRPGDVITVPQDIVGEFYVMGHVNGGGSVPLTARPITLKQAISAAGGLGPEAWPKKVEVVRRIGKNKEVTVMVDLNKIAMGLQPDFFIKPNDLINVGTHMISDTLAVLRNSFRATYGFGFIYDRNFANPGDLPNFDPIHFQKKLF